MEWPIESIPIQSILLDTSNIRIPDIKGSQESIIQDLFANEDAFEIVKSYVHSGIYPDEFPVAIRENNRIIVIEGNRRVAALKALNNPDLVPQYKSKLIQYKNLKLNQIRVVIAPNREELVKFLANKHTLTLRRNWKPLRQAYFYKSQIDNGKTIDQLKSEYPDHDITKFIRMLDMHKLAKSIDYNSSEINILVHDERKFPITNLERMYDDPSIRNFLGISFNINGQVHGHIRLSEFNKGYKKIIEDVATGEIDSRKYNTEKQKKEYVSKFPLDLKPDISKIGTFTTANIKEINLKKEELENKHGKSERSLKGLFRAKNLPFNIQNSSIKILYNELKDIPVDNFPNATHDLLRSFLECSLVNYLKNKNVYHEIQKNNKHNPKLSEMLNYIINTKSSLINDSSIIQVLQQIKSQYSEDYSLERMNMINHNENWVSTGKEVRAAWARLEKFIRILLDSSTYQ